MFILIQDEGTQAVASMPGWNDWGGRPVCRSRTLPGIGRAGAGFVSGDRQRVENPDGVEAWNPDGLVPRTVRELKRRYPELGVMTDVALDPYTTHGQDGLIDETGYILNDETVAALTRQALIQAEAGVDIVAPSDMMDGRIGAIRQALESQGLIHTRIMAYSAKYASAFLRPLPRRGGLGRQPGQEQQEGHQMDPGNTDEALREVAMDIFEGADMVMVKPGMPHRHRSPRERRVQGAHLRLPGQWRVRHDQGRCRQWLAGPRRLHDGSPAGLQAGGADGILTYFALDAAAQLRKWFAVDHQGRAAKTRPASRSRVEGLCVFPDQ